MHLRIDFPNVATPSDALATEELLRAVLAKAPTVLGFTGMIGARLPADSVSRLKRILPTCRVKTEMP